MPQLHAYLSYNGNCAEAMQFYEKALGAKLQMLMRYKEAPPEMPCTPGSEELVMHAFLVHPDFSLMAGDNPPGMPYQGIQGVSMTLSYDTVAEAHAVFDRLSAGGQVVMAPSEAFWAKTFGMVTDRFGTPWIINGELKPMA